MPRNFINWSCILYQQARAFAASCSLGPVSIIPSVLGPMLCSLEEKDDEELYKLNYDREMEGFSSVQSLSHVRLFATSWTAARQASLSMTNSWNLLKLISIEAVMLSTISSSVNPFSSHLQSFPASSSFQMSQFFSSGGQSIGVSDSASVLPMDIQD